MNIRLTRRELIQKSLAGFWGVVIASRINCMW